MLRIGWEVEFGWLSMWMTCVTIPKLVSETGSNTIKATREGSPEVSEWTICRCLKTSSYKRKEGPKKRVPISYSLAWWWKIMWKRWKQRIYVNGAGSFPLSSPVIHLKQYGSPHQPMLTDKWSCCSLLTLISYKWICNIYILLEDLSKMWKEFYNFLFNYRTMKLLQFFCSLLLYSAT